MKIQKFTEVVFFSVYICHNYIPCPRASEANLEKVDLHVHLVMLSTLQTEA